MKHYKHLVKAERLEIEILHSKGYSLRDIAGVLGRDTGTISREIDRNSRSDIKLKIEINRLRKETDCGSGGRQGSTFLCQPYTAQSAEHKAYVRRHMAKYQGKKINEDDRLVKEIAGGLKSGWTPAEISGRMRYLKRPYYISKTAIYEYLYSSWGQKYCHLLPSRQYSRKRRRSAKTKRTLIPNRISISLRPEYINNRTRYGHYEADTLISGKRHHTKAALSVLGERRAKYVKLTPLVNLKPSSHNEAVLKASRDIVPPETLTLDNGVENVKHEELTNILGTKTFFCDPYSAWQKGFIENVNKMLRRYFPKGSDLSQYSKRYIQKVEDILNNKPRESLDFKTPSEVMMEHHLLKFKKLNNDLNNIKKPLNIIRTGVALRG